LREAVNWYAEREPGLGAALVAELGQALDRIALKPLAFRVIRRRPEVRRALLPRFPYRVIFLLRDETVIVLAVLHGTRHDRRWRERL
jgi:plasmid stabilization system protein ParE